MRVNSDIRRNMPLFPMGTVMKLTDLTARQIRYYEQQGLVSPARTKGNQRLFSFNDVEKLLEIKALIDRGINLADIRHRLGTAGDAAAAGAATGHGGEGEAAGPGEGGAAGKADGQGGKEARSAAAGHGEERGGRGTAEDGAAGGKAGGGPADQTDPAHAEAELAAMRKRFRKHFMESKKRPFLMNQGELAQFFGDSVLKK